MEKLLHILTHIKSIKSMHINKNNSKECEYKQPLESLTFTDIDAFSHINHITIFVLTKYWNQTSLYYSSHNIHSFKDERLN